MVKIEPIGITDDVSLMFVLLVAAFCCDLLRSRQLAEILVIIDLFIG